MATPSKTIGNFATVDMKKGVKAVTKEEDSKEKDVCQGICFATSCKE